MNYYDATKLNSGGWHFTRTNDGRTQPVGGCAVWYDDKSHVHKTEDEARQCFRSWLLDNATYDRPRFADALYRCDVEGCEEFTDGGATDGHNTPYTLCEKHRNREGLETLIGTPGQIVSSW